MSSVMNSSKNFKKTISGSNTKKWSPTGNRISKADRTAATSGAHPVAGSGTKFLDRSTTDIAWQITGRLLAGILLYGAIGWLIGLWLGQQKLLTAAGILLGMFASLYLVFARLRHNEIESGNEPSSDSKTNS